MEIKIYKNDKEKICFVIDNTEEREFNYDNFDYLIDLVYENNNEVNYVFSDEFDDYKKLLEGIIKGSREDDYRSTIKTAKEYEANMINEEKKEDLANQG